MLLVISRGIEPRSLKRESGVVNHWTTRPFGWEARTRTLNTRVRVSSVANYATSHCISKTSSLEQVMLAVGPPQGGIRTRNVSSFRSARFRPNAEITVMLRLRGFGRGSRDRTDTMNSFKGCWPTDWPIPQHCFGQGGKFTEEKLLERTRLGN